MCFQWNLVGKSFFKQITRNFRSIVAIGTDLIGFRFKVFVTFDQKLENHNRRSLFQCIRIKFLVNRYLGWKLYIAIEQQQQPHTMDKSFIIIKYRTMNEPTQFIENLNYSFAKSFICLCSDDSSTKLVHLG